MKLLLALTVILSGAFFCCPTADAGALEQLLPYSGAAAFDIPAPPAPEPEPEAGEKGAIPACPPSMTGPRSSPCVITTKKTTVCSDGMKIETARVTEADVRAGRFPRADLGKYKFKDLRAWAEHQARLGARSAWGDGSHQSILATGRVNPFQTAYVVLPNRSWLGRDVKVCVKATGACVQAKALEVGPKTTFRTHSELSVGALMKLGLNAHPNDGTYTGEITFTFY